MMIKNKKAVSEIVSYVLLIIIAVIISGLVYSFLVLYVPKEKAECTDSIGIIVQDYSCSISENNLTIKLSNKGLFSVDAAFIRLGQSQVKDLLNNNSIYFEYAPGDPKLPPGGTLTIEYNETNSAIKSILDSRTGNDFGLEVEPAVLTDKGLALCEKAIITQTITCT